MYNINFDKTTLTDGLPSATVHRNRETKSNCSPQTKKPEQGHWESWDHLPEERTLEIRDGVTYMVKYCKRKGCIKS